MTKGKRRSAIVPAVVFSAALAVGAAVVPQIAGCDDDTTSLGYGLDVAYFGFDMAHHDLSAVAVADLGFDLGRSD
jgi:hypothetical protein